MGPKNNLYISVCRRRLSGSSPRELSMKNKPITSKLEEMSPQDLQADQSHHGHTTPDVVAAIDLHMDEKGRVAALSLGETSRPHGPVPAASTTLKVVGAHVLGMARSYQARSIPPCREIQSSLLRNKNKWNIRKFMECHVVSGLCAATSSRFGSLVLQSG